MIPTGAFPTFGNDMASITQSTVDFISEAFGHVRHNDAQPKLPQMYTYIYIQPTLSAVP